VISMRHHVVSIAAVFLALAVGVVLGSSSISERLLANVGNDRDSLGKQVADLRSERDLLKTNLADANRFSGAVAPMAVRGQLDQRTVVLISSSDARPEDREALKRLLASAGARVTGELQLTEGISDPDRADQLRQVVTRLLPAGVQLPTAFDPGTLAGGLLGPLTLLNPRTGQPQTSPQERAAALGGLTDGGFISGAQDMRPGQLAIVLAGGKGKGPDAGDRAATLARLATQVDRAGAGAVLAGSSGSSEGGGPVGVARADTTISSVLSTVDNVDVGAGRVATVLALRERWEKQVGHYGAAASAQGPIPSPRS
jgi:hypothetical protein